MRGKKRRERLIGHRRQTLSLLRDKREMNTTLGGMQHALSAPSVECENPEKRSVRDSLKLSTSRASR